MARAAAINGVAKHSKKETSTAVSRSGLLLEFTQPVRQRRCRYAVEATDNLAEIGRTKEGPPLCKSASGSLRVCRPPLAFGAKGYHVSPSE